MRQENHLLDVAAKHRPVAVVPRGQAGHGHFRKGAVPTGSATLGAEAAAGLAAGVAAQFDPVRQAVSSFFPGLALPNPLLAGMVPTPPPAPRLTKTSRAQLIQELGPGVSAGFLRMCAVGKGPPDVVAAYLRLVARYGMAKAGLQAFADDGARNIGIDCSGFVTNYFIARGAKERTVEVLDNTPARSYDEAARRRSQLEDVAIRDVMVWHDGGHVAVIDSIPARTYVKNKDEGHAHAKAHGHAHAAASKAPVAAPAAGTPAPAVAPADGPPPGTHAEYTCTVVESNGGRGLDAEEYTLVSVDKQGMFTVRRKTESHDHHVHINDWDLN